MSSDDSREAGGAVVDFPVEPAATDGVVVVEVDFDISAALEIPGGPPRPELPWILKDAACAEGGGRAPEHARSSELAPAQALPLKGDAAAAALPWTVTSLAESLAPVPTSFQVELPEIEDDEQVEVEVGAVSGTVGTFAPSSPGGLARPELPWTLRGAVRAEGGGRAAVLAVSLELASAQALPHKGTAAAAALPWTVAFFANTLASASTSPQVELPAVEADELVEVDADAACGTEPAEVGALAPPSPGGPARPELPWS